MSPGRVVVIPLDLANLVCRVFLPANPRKMRSAAPEVVKAAEDFKDLVITAHQMPDENAAVEAQIRSLLVDQVLALAEDESFLESCSGASSIVRAVAHRLEGGRLERCRSCRDRGGPHFW